MGAECRVQGAECRVVTLKSVEFRVQSVGCRRMMQGAVCSVQVCRGAGVQGAGCRAQEAEGCNLKRVACKVHRAEYRVQSARCRGARCMAQRRWR